MKILKILWHVASLKNLIAAMMLGILAVWLKAVFMV